MLSHRLGMHWLRYHPDNEDFAHVRRMGYRSVKVFEWMWADAAFCRALLEVLPADALILARDHPLSEQKEGMWRDPVGTGRRHAAEWGAKVRGGRYLLPARRTHFLGINEPDATSGDRAAIDRYTVAFLDGLREQGLKGGAFNFSTGHPRTVDGTADTPPDYSVFEASHQAIVRGGHIAVCHIYGVAAQACVPGHFDRLRACPWQDVTWIVGECGIDEHVVGGGPHYGFHIPYTGQLANYVGWLDALILGANDPRIHSWQVFTYDFSHPWDTFDVRAIRSALEETQWQHGDAASTAPPPMEQPSTVHLPIVSGPEQPPSDDCWQRSIDFVLRWEGGYQSIENDRGNWTGGKIGAGELKGTKYGISAASYPHLDIKNLTLDEAKAIYRRDYWQASGADKQPWPACLLVMDTAVLHGVGAATQWLKEAGPDPYQFAAKRLRVYTGMDNWHYWGAAWVKRVADLLEAMTG